MNTAPKEPSAEARAEATQITTDWRRKHYVPLNDCSVMDPLDDAIATALDAKRVEIERHSLEKANLQLHWNEERDNLKQERDTLTQQLVSLQGEIDMLRGVGCCEDGDGPCGVCLKCYKQQLEQAVELAVYVQLHYNFQRVEDFLSSPAIAPIVARLKQKGSTNE